MLPGLFIYSFSLLLPFLETSAGGRGGGEGLGGHRPHFGGSGGDYPALAVGTGVLAQRDVLGGDLGAKT